MGKGRNPIAGAALFFNLPEDTAAGEPKLTVTGSRRALVENHKGVFEFSGECIEINGGRTRLRVRGVELTLLSMTRSELLIGGRISSVEFS